jgi:hypothetical protein
MLVTVTKIYQPVHPWDSTRTGVGVAEDLTVLTFAGDTRVMETLRERIEEAEDEDDVQVEIEPWQVLAILRPAQVKGEQD